MTLITGIVSEESRPFVSTWNTTNTSTGSSASDQIKLPTHSGATYNFVVDWGDGTSDRITTWNQAETTHTYASSGVKTLKITGIFPRIRFVNAGDKLKITNISQWGVFKPDSSGLVQAFWGCSNLTITAADILDTRKVTSMYWTFRDCVNITNIPNITSWNLSQNTSWTACFFGAGIAQDLSRLNVTSNVTSVANMFTNGYIDFDFGTYWDWTQINTAASFFNGKISTTNYSNALIGIEAQNVLNNVTLNCGTSKYSAGAAADARQRLITDHFWTIVDGGQE